VVLAKYPELVTKIMRTNASLHADQARCVLANRGALLPAIRLWLQTAAQGAVFCPLERDGASTLHVFQEDYEPLPTSLLHPSVFH
jgi:hypothetical protein